MFSMPVPSLKGAHGERVFGKMWKLFLHINFFGNTPLVETFAKVSKKHIMYGFHELLRLAVFFSSITLFLISKEKI